MNRHDLLRFMRSCRYAVEASVTTGGAPQAAVVGIAVTDAFEVVFDALETSRKVQNLRVNRRAAFVIGAGCDGDERTVQFEGLADEPLGAELDRVTRAYYAVFPDGPDRRKWPGITYVRVAPVWIRYSDYNVSPPVIVEFAASDLDPDANEL
jgi:hypothetical protein